ncbi:MAG: MFS transporter [bacterium]|nr:MFS transporter [bacterium]
MWKLRLPDLSRPEIRVAALLCGYYFLVMCAFSVIKPVRSALLLDRLGISWLPVGFVGAAVVTGLVVFVVGWLDDRLPERRRVSGSMAILFLNLLMFRFLFDQGSNWVALVFYIWANLFSSILIMQFWLVAGDLFTPREAKRLFGWVGAGGIVGAIVGPGLAFNAVAYVGTENLIWISAGFLMVCLPLVRHLEQRRPDGRNEVPDDGGAPSGAKTGIDLLREVRHLKLIAVICGVSMIVQTIVDYQFNEVVAQAFDSVEAKTAFFAQFFAGMNVLSLVLQLVVTRFVLTRFGVGLALSLLPVGLLFGSLGILISPTLMVVAAARLGEGGIRYSIQEATREILYQPVPSSVRSKVRPLIDIFGGRLFEGIGGLIILLCTGVLGFSVSGLSWISVGLIVVWGLAVLAVKQEYLNALRGLFADLSVQSQDRAAEVLDDNTVSLLVSNLESENEVLICQSLAMLDLMHDKTNLVPHLRQVMSHSSAEVRAKALGLLAEAGEGGFFKAAEGLLKEEAADIRVEGVRYLCRFGEDDKRGVVAQLLKDPDFRIRIAAIGVVASSGRMDKDEVMAALKELQSGEEDVPSRAEAARMLGTLNDETYDDVLVQFLRDPSPVVVRSALDSVAQTARRIFIPIVVPYLGDERLMLFAQRTIRAFGDRVLGTLRDYMDDPGEPETLRRAVPGCLTTIGTPQAVQVLLALLPAHQQTMGEAIVEALGEMRNRDEALVFDPGRVKAALVREAGDGQNRLRVISGLLALIYPVEDILRAFKGLQSEQKEVRAQALELLDTLMDSELKRRVLPSIESELSQRE